MDVYGLGCTLYELLTGRPAIDGSDRAQVLHRLAFEDPVPPRTIDKRVPADLETISLKALTKDAGERYQSAKELADDLRRFWAETPIRAQPFSLSQRTRKWAQRNRAAVVAFTCVSLVMALAAAGSIGWVARDASTRRTAAEHRIVEALGVAESRLAEGNPYAPDLIEAKVQAETQVRAAGASADLRRRVDQLNSDMEMLKALETAQSEIAANKGDNFDAVRGSERFSRAFSTYGIDVEGMATDEAVAAIRNTAIAPHLVAALDVWASNLSTMNQKDRADHVFVVANLVDSDPWRERLRRALAIKDESGLEELCRSADVSRLPVAAVGLIAGPHRIPGGTSLASSAAQVDLLRKVQRAHQSDFWTNHDLGMVLVTVHPPALSEGIGYLRAAVALRPGSSGARLNLGYALWKLRKFQEAVDQYEEAIRLQPVYSAAHENLGTVLCEMGDTDRAMTALNKAIALDPDCDAHNSLGICFGAKKRFDDAIREFQTSIRIAPRDPEGYRNLGFALALKGDRTQAISEYRHGIQVCPTDAALHSQLGNALQAEKQFAEAADEFRSAAQLAPNDPNNFFGLALALGPLERFDEAIAALQDAIRIDKDHAEAQCNLGHLLWKKGRFGEALAAIRHGHEMGSARPDWPYPSAEWLRKAETLAAIDERLSAVLRNEAKPSDADELHTFAVSCQQFRKRYATATRFYSDAFALNPRLGADPSTGDRYNAACAAALAGCGKGEDAFRRRAARGGAGVARAASRSRPSRRTSRSDVADRAARGNRRTPSRSRRHRGERRANDDQSCDTVTPPSRRPGSASRWRTIRRSASSIRMCLRRGATPAPRFCRSRRSPTNRRRKAPTAAGCRAAIRSFMRKRSPRRDASAMACGASRKRGRCTASAAATWFWAKAWRMQQGNRMP